MVLSRSQPSYSASAPLVTGWFINTLHSLIEYTDGLSNKVVCCFEHSAIGVKTGLSQVTEWNIAWHSWWDRCVCVCVCCVCAWGVQPKFSRDTLPWSDSDGISDCLHGPTVHYVSSDTHTHTRTHTHTHIWDNHQGSAPRLPHMLSVALLILRPSRTAPRAHACECSRAIILFPSLCFDTTRERI